MPTICEADHFSPSNENSWAFPGSRGAFYLWGAEVMVPGIEFPELSGFAELQSGTSFNPGTITGAGGLIIAGCEHNWDYPVAASGWTLQDNTTSAGCGGCGAGVFSRTGSGSQPLPVATFPSDVWAGGWMALPGGAIRQFKTYSPSLPGSGATLSFDKVPYVGSLIVAFQAAGVYWGSGLNAPATGFTTVYQATMRQDWGDDVDNRISVRYLVE